MSLITRLTLVLLITSTLPSCRKGFQTTSHTPEEIGRYIAARVPAVIDVNESVRIRFSVPVDTSQTTSVFSFDPSTEGTYAWDDCISPKAGGSL